MQNLLETLRNATPEQLEELRQLINWPRIEMPRSACPGPPVFSVSRIPSGLYDNDDSE